MTTTGEVKEFSVQKEYEKNPDITREDISKLRQWLLTQPHLPQEHITDLDLVLIYHCCGRSSSVSKDVLDLNFTLKTLFTSFFKDRSLDKRAAQAHEVTLLLPLSYRAWDNSTIIYCRLLDYDAKNFIFSDIMRSVLMVIDLWQYEEGTWPGFVIIIDLDRVTLSHLARLDIQTTQQFLYFLQEAMLVILKSVHFLNAPSFMDKLMMILKPFMKKQLLDMLHIHQIGSNTLDKFLDSKQLPKESEYPKLKEQIWARMQANSKFFQQENKKRVTESRRPGKPKTISDIFGGIEGSFKKLDID